MRGSLTEFRDLREDLVSGFRPDEGLRRIVGDREVLANGGFEGADTSMGAAFNLLLARSANQRSTRLSQDALVGVKCTWNRGWRTNQRRTDAVLCVP
jgi:hypothetical protein